jgi:diguanylate cyclase (GGDEF)-like protein
MELHRRALTGESYPPLPYGLPTPRPLSPVGVFPKGDSRSLNLLLVEHDPAYAAHLKGILETCKNPGLRIEWTEWLDAATHRLREGGADAVLLDISLPDISGIAIFRTLHRAAPEVPVLILADLDDETVACRIIREGAQDFLSKRAMNPQHLHRSIRFAVERSKAKKGSARKGGRLSGDPVSDWETLPALRPSSDESNRPLPGRLVSLERMGQDAESATLGLHSEIPFPPLGQTTRLLMVEPSDRDYRKLRACLKGHKEIRMIRTKTIRRALAFLTRHAFDLVCLDYFLPDGNGHDFLTKVKELTLDTPVVIITGHSDPVAAAQIIQAGAYDFLPKQNLNQSPLLRVIGNALEKARFRKQIKEAQRKIVEMSVLDDLTGLLNRRCFMETLEKETERACRYGTPLVLCMMDVDEFKRVNDTYGHQAGDMVLQELGSLLRKSIRMSDTACRYGGEEFALLLPNTDLGEAKLQGERLRRMIETHRFEWKGTPFRVTLSFGLTRLNNATNPSSTSLLEDADKALYKAKRDGKNRVVVCGGDQPL